MVQTQNVFDHIRNLAVGKLECEIFRKLHIIYNSQRCTAIRGPLEIPNKLYSWRMSNYLERRKLENCVWLDVLMKDISSNCLQTLKLKDDLVEVLHYLKIIFNGLVADPQELNIDKYVIAPISEAKKLLKVLETTIRSKKMNENMMKAFMMENAAFDVRKRDSIQEQLKLNLEITIANNDIWFPIEIRYQLRHYQSNVTQASDKYDNEEIHLENEMKLYLQMHQTESYCSQCVMNMYYAQIENYKNSISSYIALYDSEYEKIENKISIKKLAIEKLREQWRFLREQMKQFGEEMKRIEQKEIAAREAEILRKQRELEEMEEQQALLNMQKSSKKSKKKYYY